MRCEEFEAAMFQGKKPDAAMREHAAQCEACRVLMEQADMLAGARMLEEDIELPESFTRGWREAIRAQSAKKRRFSIGRLRLPNPFRDAGPKRTALRVVAIACCALALIGIGSQYRLSATPGDTKPSSYPSQRNTALRYSTAGGAMDAGAAYEVEAPEELLEEEGFVTADDADLDVDEDRKIVRSAQLSMKTEAFDAAIESVRTYVRQAGGEIALLEVYTAYDDYRRASIELTVPEAALDDFLSGAGALGEITRQVISAQDMTSAYRDNASRLESARAQKQRLDELYALAQDMTDIVTITDALFDVQQEIDDLSGANRRIDTRVANSQVSMSIAEVAETKELTFLEQLGEQVGQGAQELGAFFQSMALFIAWALPWFALLAVIALIVVIAVRRARKR